MKPYPNLFSEVRFGKRMLKNRIVLSPMGETMADPDGTMSEQAIAYYTEIAKGGCSVISPGVVCVDYPVGKPEKVIFRVDEVKYIKDFNRLAESVHRYGAMLIPQIHHAGGQTDITITDGHIPLCVSDMDVEHALLQPHRQVGPQKEMTTEDITLIIQKFIQAAVNCQKAKCDGVSIHAAHGYLINQFLSPSLNARTDEYGGSFDNRARFGVQIIEGIRKACGPKFIIGARIPGKEWVSNGLTDAECCEIARRFEAAGCDYLDISIGATNVFTTILETERYEQGNRVPFAENIKKAVSIPVGAVGALRDPWYCEKLIEEGRVDFVSLGRALICDPNWPKKAASGKADEIRPCISCFDGCTNRLFDGCAISCALNPVVGRESDIGRLQKTDSPKKVTVIGGGPGGMQAAIVAARIGHRVTLLEKTDKLGGQLNLACIPPHKEKIGAARDWFAGELVRQGVEVILDCEANLKTIKSLNPDAIIAATGAKPVDKIPVQGLENTVQAWDVINGDVAIPEKAQVTIIGGGIVGCETAQMLLEKENNVTILEMLPNIANGLEILHTIDLLTEFANKHVNVQTGVKVIGISKDSVSYEKDGKEENSKADMIILSVGQKPEGVELIKELKEAGYHVVIAGDAKNPAKIIDATRDGFFAGLDI